jgi:hypothetical protein
VAAQAAHRHVHGVDVRVAIAFGDANLAGGDLRVVMQAEHEIGLGEASVKAVVEQRARA